MKAVITGGSGFVGKRLAKALIDKGWKVIIFSRSNKNSGLTKTVKVNYFDIDDLTKNLEGTDIIFHLAAVLFANNKQEFEKGNATLTANLVAAAKKTKTIKHFVYQSSLAVAGPSKNTDNLIDENCTCMPISDYGKTKLLGEEEVKKLPPQITYTILRAPTVYGGAEAGVSKISAWVKRGLMVNPSKKDMYFSFVYVGDLVNSLVLAATNDNTKNETFFISEESIYTWEDFIAKLAIAMGIKKPIILNLPSYLLKFTGFCYGSIAKITHTVPALNYDKVTEALAPGHWACSSKKWLNLTGQKFLSLDEGLKKTYKK
ncbi:MAG: NAD-dependent epimerase/dehydratase family protein [Elusimicrobiaceae bacterium]|nr:NAD-dependent epimerase/dehydratase family protein [Elusimicrobiaceae bacterium]